MNANIEVINPHLLGVRFDWLKAGFVNIPLIPKNQLENSVVHLTVDGIVVLDKNARIYDYAKKALINIMRLSDSQIKKRVKNLTIYKGKSNLTEHSELFLKMLKAEQTRRELLNMSKGKTKQQLEKELKVFENSTTNT